MENYKKNTLLEGRRRKKSIGVMILFSLFLGIYFIGNVLAFDWSTNIDGYYKFDESSGSVVSEEVAQKNLTALNSPVWTSGIINNALNFTSGSSQFAFNGTEHYYTLGGNNWSLSTWVYPYSISGNQIIAIANSNWAVRLSGDEVGFSAIRNGTTSWIQDQFTTNANIVNENWYHVAVTYNGSGDGVKFYVNGVLKTIGGTWGTNTIPRDVGDGSFRIGGDNDTDDYAGAYFNGKIDEMGIFNRTFTDTEVLELYNSGMGLPYSTGAVSINVSLVSPANATTLTNLTNNSFVVAYNSTLAGYDLINSTYYIWYSNGTVYNNSYTVDLTGLMDTLSTAYFNFTELGDYIWNAYACMGNGEPTNCTFSSNNNSFNIGYYRVNSVTYDSTAYETDSSTFVLNITLGGTITLTSATFYYNGTSYSPSIASNGFDRVITNTITLPEVSAAVNLSFFWALTLNNGTSVYLNTTNLNQTVNTLDIDDCTTNTHKILNYSVFDEDNRSFLDNSSWNTSANIYVKLSGDFSGDVYTYYSSQITANSINICIADALVTGQNYRLDSEIQYSAANHVTEYYYTENYSLNTSSSPLNISLYSLASDNSQEFLINYKDAYYTPSSGALIYLYRQYLDIGQKLIVEVIKTDNDGNTIGHFVLNDEIYDLYVYKNGVLEAIFPNQRAFCTNLATGDCRINLNAASLSSTADSFLNNLGVDYSQIYNDSTKTYTLTYNVVDNSVKTILVNITKYDNFNNVTVCTDTESSSSGTLTCIIPSTYYSDTLLIRVYVDGELLATSLIPATISKAATLGTARYLLAFFLILTIPLLAGSSGVMTLVFLGLGMIAAGSLALIDFTYLGIGSILWLAIAGGILWWKANRNKEI